MHADYPEYIVGYRALGEYTGRPAPYWRTRASDGMLPFARYRLPGRQVGFLITDVDRYMAEAKGRDDWYGEPLSIDLADIHNGAENAAAALHEISDDKEALDRLIKNSRHEDAKRIRNQLAMTIQRAVILWLAAAISASKSRTPKGNQFALKLRNEGGEAAFEYIARDFGFFADNLKAFTDVDFYTEDGAALSDMARAKGYEI